MVKGFVIVGRMGMLQDMYTRQPCFYRHKRSAERARRRFWDANACEVRACERYEPGELQMVGANPTLPSFVL